MSLMKFSKILVYCADFQEKVCLSDVRLSFAVPAFTFNLFCAGRMHTPIYRTLNKTVPDGSRSFGETEPLLLVDADGSDSEVASPVIHRTVHTDIITPTHVYRGLSPIATHQYDKCNFNFQTVFFE